MPSRYLGLVVTALLAGLAIPLASQEKPTGPRYDAEGNLLLPDGFETWVFVGSSLGLTYSDNPPSHDMFHSVYIDPTAYRRYVETGTFPDPTMLAMTLYEAEKKTDFGSGLFSGERHGLEVAVKDGEWAYYDFGGMGGKPNDKARAFPRARCSDCHREHAKDDNVFVQYYPVLRRLSRN
jgi:hypothetical protein